MIAFQFWHWLALGLVLLTLEIFLSGAFALGMGVAAVVVAVLLWSMPALTWETQVFAFAALSLVSIVVLRKYLASRPVQSDRPLLNRRGQQYVGRVFTLADPIVNGRGKIHVDDSTWRIEGADCAAGARVRVTGVDGTVLVVEEAQAGAQAGTQAGDRRPEAGG